MATLQLLSDRQPIWSGSAHELEVPMAAASAVIEAGLDNHVSKLRLFAERAPDDLMPTDRYILADLENNRTFGNAVSKDYKYYQNMELAEMIDATLGEEYPCHSLGRTPNGSGVFFLLDGGPATIAKEDIHQYFMIVDMRSGGFSLKSAFGVHRIQCLNQLMTQLSNANMLLSARHDRQFQERATGATRFLAAAHRVQQETLRAFQRMAERPISKEQFEALLASTYPIKRGDKLAQLEAIKVDDAYFLDQVSYQRKAFEYHRDRMMERRNFVRAVFDNFQTTNPALRGTVWAAYNATVEAEDHGYTAGESILSQRRSALFGDRADTKLRALQFASSLILN